MIRFILLLFLLLPAGSAQPVPQVQTILDHNSRFLADIPATWIPDRAQEFSWVSPDRSAFLAAGTFTTETDLTSGCTAVARTIDPLTNPADLIVSTSFAAQEACTVRTRSDHPEAPVGLVYLHPNPLAGADGPYFAYAWVIIDHAHFDTVTTTMRFNLDEVTPELYVYSVIDLVQMWSIVRDEIPWQAVRAAAQNATEQGGTGAGLQTIFDALQEAGDSHSYFWSPTQLDTFVTTDSGDVPEIQLPSATTFHDRIGYLYLPPAQGDHSVSEAYATAGNQAIRNTDGPGICGWIVDLRTNYGGNIDPMVVAIGEFLVDGPVAGRTFSNGQVAYVAYQDGALFPANGVPGSSLVSGPVYQPLHPDAPVAVLIGPVTGSAAEFTALALRNRPDTMFFGLPTAGLTTGIRGFVLMDGSALGLAISWMIDSRGTPFPAGIPPQVETPYTEPAPFDSSDAVITAATDWLLQQPGCT